TEMAGLLRDILHNRVIRTVVHDQSLDLVMEELSAIRGEIRAIGVNVNQITKYFNTYPEPQRKAFYAKTAFSRYVDLQPKIETLLQIVAKLAQKWLQESPAAGR
ncbi:plasmid mobilization relaxosome protein MobC, partial [uncultured Chitinophaga sp.]|uniref:plasmid mobilization relaxosome protein MobC n=1 Tax=uncultured Chitinophaga sp. TaxID=339340 RepID=UPI0026040918